LSHAYRTPGLPSPGLRRFFSIGTDVEDPRIAQLVGELSLASEPFRRLWTRHDVRALAGAPTRMCHPQVGMLEPRREKLPIGDSGGQLLVICQWRSRTALASTDEATAEGRRRTRAAHLGARIVRSLVSGPRHDQFRRK
jgi:hypothetical protein